MNRINSQFAIWARKLFNIVSRDALDTLSNGVRTDALAMQFIAPLNVNFTPWTKPAMRPGAVASILNDIVVNRRKIIVECGSGISTIYIARLLNQLGRGQLYSIEHDENWIEILADLLKAEKERTTFIHAPLVQSSSSQTRIWYDISPIKKTLSQAKIDMLIVDGPPASKPGDLIRYPAVPELKDSLSDNCCVVLDDINRRGEKEILELWKKELNLDFYVVSHAAIGLSSSAYKSYV